MPLLEPTVLLFGQTIRQEVSKSETIAYAAYLLPSLMKLLLSVYRMRLGLCSGYLSGLAGWSRLHQAPPGSHAPGPQLVSARRWQGLEFLLLPVLLMCLHIGALGTGSYGLS